MTVEARGRRLSRKIDYLGHIRERLQDLAGFETLAHELLQNAEDAHATHVVFDVRDDALIVENDAAFSDCDDIYAERCPRKAHGLPSCDWHNLREIAAGQKRDRVDAIGKFGVGFIAVYQLTDRPEVISGRHWCLEEDKPEQDRIYLCPGCPECAARAGTRFVLPYARDRRSALRIALAAPAVTEADTERLPGALRAAAAESILFMEHLRSIEIRRDGAQVASIAMRASLRHGLGEREVTVDGTATTWYLVGGTFADRAAEIRAVAGAEVIEPHRSTNVTLAVRADASVAGRLCAGLPTDSSTQLPFHINAAFFPSTDRKRVLLDTGDHRSRWNQAALTSAALAFAGALPPLRDALGAIALWDLFVGIERASGQEDRIVTAMRLGDFRTLVASRVHDGELAWTASGHWTTVQRAPVLPEAPSEDTIPALAAVGIDPMHSDLRSAAGQLMASEWGLRRLTIDALASRTAEAGLGRRLLRSVAPAALQTNNGLRALWVEFERLLKFDQRTGARREELRRLLARCALAPSDDLLVPLGDAVATDSDGAGLVQSLGLEVALLDPAFDPPEGELIGLCRRLDVACFEHAASALSATAWSTRYATGAYRPEVLLEWLATRKAELEASGPLRDRLRDLPAFPTRDGLVPLEDASLPGDFDDPLDIAELLAIRDVDRHRPILALLGVRQLTFAEFATIHVPRAFADSVSVDVRRNVVATLAIRAHEVERDVAIIGALRGAPLVECHDGTFRVAGAVVLDSPATAELLGDSVPRACIPEAGYGHVALYVALGARVSPSAADLDRRIADLIEHPDDDVVARLERLCIHLQDRLEEPPIHALVEGLRDRAWLPARDEEDWYAPDEIYAVFQDYLFASQGPFLAFSRDAQSALSRRLFSVLGVTSEPPAALVVEHLLASAALERPVNERVYDFLARNAADAALGRLRGTACIWVGESYHRPDEVFWADHPFGGYRWKLSSGWIVYRAFFDAVGVVDSPTAPDAVAVLRELADAAALEDADRDVIVGSWRLLAELGEDGAAAAGHLSEVDCALDRNGGRVEPRRLYFEDRAQLAERFPPSVRARIVAYDPLTAPALRAAGARDLGDAATVALLEKSDPRSAAWLTGLCRDRGHAIRRVIETSGLEGSASLASIEFLEVDRLKVRYVLHDEPDHAATEPEEPPALFVGHGTLYVRAGSRQLRAIARELAAALVGARNVAAFAPAIGVVLAADDSADAEAALDDYGIAVLADEGTYVPPEMAFAAEPTGEAEAEPDEGETAEAPSSDAQRVSEVIVTEREAGVATDFGAEPAPATTEAPPPPARVGTAPAEDVATGAPAPVAAADADAHPEGDGRSGVDGGTRQSPSGDDRRAAKRGRPAQRAREFLHSYVEITPKDPPDTGEQDDDAGPDVDALGIALVVRREREAGRDPHVLAHNHPGYDIESYAADGSIERYIEVKSLSGSWIDPQPGLSQPQHGRAVELGDTFWLYIAERVGTESEDVHAIRNPVLRATHFGFDPGWLAVAEDPVLGPDVIDDDEPEA